MKIYKLYGGPQDGLTFEETNAKHPKEFNYAATINGKPRYYIYKLRKAMKRNSDERYEAEIHYHYDRTEETKS